MTPNERRRLQRQIRAKRRRRVRLILIAVLFILLMLFIFIIKKATTFVLNLASQKPASAVTVQINHLEDIYIPPVTNLDPEILGKLRNLAKQDERAVPVLEHLNEYPANLLELLAKNAETLDFILDYPEKKDAPAAGSVGTVKKGTIPLLFQWDSRWGYTAYGDDMIALSGCGPTVLSMVASGLTGDNTITPAKIADYAQQHGYYVRGTGTSWDLIYSGCQNFGLSAKEISLSESIIARQLENGHPVICSMKAGDFTTGGHFIVLTGYKDGKFKIHDPNSKERSAQAWSFSRLQGQINNLWAFSLL